MSGVPCPKQHMFRSQKLRDLANECPRCMSCRKPRDGTIVLCHSNSLRHGKGRGIKAHDMPCYMCRKCHNLADGRDNGMTKREQDEMIQDATWWSTLWLLQDGRMKVV